VNATSLPAWTLNGGSNGGNGDLLNTVEYAGLLTFSDPNDTVHLPWHILPHKSANVQTGTSLALGGNPTPLPISNLSAPISGPVDAFSLTGTGVKFPASALPAPGDDFAVINLQSVGVRLVCTASLNGTCTAYGAQFAVTTFGQRSHPDVPAEFDIFIDTNNDGNPDFDVFNEDIGLATTGTISGQNGVFVANLAAGTAAGPYFYTTADLDSANAILTVPLSALGGMPVNQPFTFDAVAFDNYYTGNLTDIIAGMKYELDMPKEYAQLSSFGVPPGFNGTISVIPNNAYNGNSPSQKGILFLYTNGKTGQESSAVTVTP
jgi:hypothetical protein